jgi:hypothetical protein
MYTKMYYSTRILFLPIESDYTKNTGVEAKGATLSISYVHHLIWYGITTALFICFPYTLEKIKELPLSFRYFKTKKSFLNKGFDICC